MNFAVRILNLFVQNMYWSWSGDSNPEPTDYKSVALTIAPDQHMYARGAEAFRRTNLAPRAGLEPATYGLTVRRSTYWTNEEYI